jgi:hypothetical protein
MRKNFGEGRSTSQGSFDQVGKQYRVNYVLPFSTKELEASRLGPRIRSRDFNASMEFSME